MKPLCRAAAFAALALSAAAISPVSVAQNAPADAPITSLAPAFADSKAGVFVLAFPAQGGNAAALAQALTEITTMHAGMAAAIVGGAASGSVVSIDDPGGAVARRFSASAGETVAIDRTGKEIARFAAGTSGAAIASRIETFRAAPTREYNIPSKTALALEGYDPTSYFDAPKPAKGDAKVTSNYRGVVYRFISAQTREKFNADPEKYVPTYGGWCATAMAEGDKVEVDPTNYKVTRGRLFLFYKGFLGNARNDWEKNEDALEKKADGSWAKIAK